MTYLAPRMREPAFKTDPDPRFIYLDVARRRLLAELLAHAESGTGIAVLEGETGLGKTMLLRQLEQDAANHALPLLRPAIGTGGADMGEQLAALANGTAERSLLVLDDADRLPMALWRQLFALLQARPDAGRGDPRRFAVALSARPDVAEWLASPPLAQTLSGIHRHRLAAFASRDVALYIRHRLNVARGSERDPFTSEAVERITVASSGIPLQINRLCATAIAIAELRGEAAVSADIVEHAITELARADASGPGSIDEDTSGRTAVDIRGAPLAEANSDWQAYRTQLAAFHGAAAGAPGLAEPAAPAFPPWRSVDDATDDGRLPLSRRYIRRRRGVQIVVGGGLVLAGAIGALLLPPARQDAPPPLTGRLEGSHLPLAPLPPVPTDALPPQVVEPATGIAPSAAEPAPPVWNAPAPLTHGRSVSVSPQWSDDMPPDALPAAGGPKPATGLGAAPAAISDPPAAKRVAAEAPPPPAAKRPGPSSVVRPDPRTMPEAVPAPRQAPAASAREAPDAAVSGGVDGGDAAENPSHPRPVREILAIGDEFRQSGDLDYARRYYRAALDRGSARAATAMGETYDPQRVAATDHPDTEEARRWYARAAEMGDREAARRLADLDGECSGGEPR